MNAARFAMAQFRPNSLFSSGLVLLFEAKQRMDLRELGESGHLEGRGDEMSEGDVALAK